MLRQEIEEQLAERLVDRIEQGNAFILEKIGNAIKTISTLNPNQAYQLSQILKYGGSYEEILKELSKISKRNIQDIQKIFEEVAKNNKQFAKDFYRYRGIDYIPYSKDTALQNQVTSIARLTANSYINIANSRVIGLVQDNTFKPLQQAYQDIIDRAIINLIQGKQDFYSSMRESLKELGSNGVVTYESGQKRRLDSAVRMNILDAIRQLNNETSRRFGQEYNADGVEISVHSNPAPDHADIQGRQFSNEEYDKLEAGQIAKDYKGHTYDGSDKRHISEYNCYHKIFAIVLGVSEPEYTDKQLKEIQDKNEQGFDFDGKHYTMYEGTQLQRRIETEIRKQKDTQILAKASGDMELVGECQSKITKLLYKYNELCNISGLKSKKQRMSVSGYQRINIKNMHQYEDNLKPLNTIEDIVKYVNSRKDDLYGLDVKQNQLKLNERYNFNDKPTLLEPQEFEQLKDYEGYYGDPTKAKQDENILVFRGWDKEKYFEQYINGKNSYGEGGYIDGVGTYATDNESSALIHANNDYNLLMEIAIPGNAKFISKQDLMELHYNIYNDYNANRLLYLDKYGDKVVEILDEMNNNISSTAVLNGFEIVYNNENYNWVILNRSILKIKKKNK